MSRCTWKKPRGFMSKAVQRKADTVNAIVEDWSRHPVCRETASYLTGEARLIWLNVVGDGRGV